MTARLVLLVTALVLVAGLWARAAGAQEEQTRTATFYWNPQKSGLYMDFSFRDVVDAEIQDKLSRGLPTKLILTGVVFQAGSDTPLASTYQSCKVTWHVWEEMYRVEITTPEQVAPRKHWTPTLAGVLRRCAEAHGLLIAGPSQVAVGASVSVRGTVRVNPISDELSRKLKHWVSLPSRNAAAAPGSALFSTFTGLFMQRIGDAERTLVFRTPLQVPQ